MSESAARVKRRDLRRAVGESAIGVIDQQGKAVSEIANLLNWAVANQKALEKRIHAGETLGATQGRINAANDDRIGRLLNWTARVDRFMARSFWQRMRWLVTGR
jgi:hypothetical protein